MLRILRLLVNFLEKCLAKSFAHLKNKVVYSLNCKRVFFCVYSEYKPLIRYVICKHLLPFCGLPFHFVDPVVQKLLSLMWSHLLILGRCWWFLNRGVVVGDLQVLHSLQLGHTCRLPSGSPGNLSRLGRTVAQALSPSRSLRRKTFYSVQSPCPGVQEGAPWGPHLSPWVWLRRLFPP